MSRDFDALTVLVAARNEEERIGETVAALRKDFPDAEILVVDGRSEDGTARRAESAGAVVIRVERLGKGEALSAGSVPRRRAGSSFAMPTCAARSGRS